MANRSFKILSAMCLLLFYLWGVITGNLALIFCDCHSHNHSLYSHSIIVAEHHCSCEECHHNAFCGGVIEQKCDCHHNHSVDVELYTISRGDNDEGSERFVLLHLLASDFLSVVEPSNESRDVEYGEYLLPPLSVVAKGCAALRAPPALV